MKPILFLLIILGYIRSITGYNYTVIDEPKGIFIVKTYDTYLAYNQWRLYYFLDIKDFYEDLQTLENCISTAQEICSMISDNEKCQALVSRLQRQFNTARNDMDYVESFYEQPTKKVDRIRKKKAPLGFLTTYIFKPLFGVMDEEDATEINNKINELIVHSNDRHIFMKDELSIIRQTIQTTNATIKSMWNELDKHQRKLNEALQDHIQKIEQKIDIIYLSSVATLIIVEHNRRIKLLKDLLKDVFDGNTRELVPWYQLREDLDEVNSRLDGSTILLSRNEREIQSMVSYRGSMEHERLLNEITVPIVNRNPYKLTKVTTLPISLNNQAILIDTENMEYLVNERLLEYIPISEYELRQCKKLTKKRLICSPQAHAFLRSEESCESEIIFGGELNNLLNKCDIKFIHGTDYVKRIEENLYYVYINRTMSITERCDKKYYAVTNITKPGILTMTPNCDIQMGNIKISARSSKTSGDIPKIESPYEFSQLSLKNIDFLTSKKRKVNLPQLIYVDYDKDFGKLVETIDQQQRKMEKQIERTTPMSRQVYFTYWHLAALCIVIIMYKTTKKFISHFF